MDILERTGSAVWRDFSHLLDMSTLFLESLKAGLNKRSPGKGLVFDVAMNQILFTGVEAMTIVGVIALLLGAATIIETFSLVPDLGGDPLIGKILVVVVVRELGPIITAFIIIGRSGTAISTEIGYMMVNHEIQALEMMGINPIRYVVFPRIVGMSVAVFCLSFFFTMVALFGGYMVSRLIIQYPFTMFLEDLSRALGFWDVAVSGIKCFFFGIIVAVICCYQGFSVRFSFTEIPQVATRAVVWSIYACFAVNIIITAFFYI
ncbi:MAG: ABC transporter permease [Elusimicrobia bacterium]|nr:ABC transporter permease [Elusimicrobiota bacterium]